MNNYNKTINIGKNKDRYEIPLKLLQMSIYLDYFSSNANRELNHIFGLLDLDNPSRKKNHNTIEFNTHVNERRNLRIINKALTMELFTSSMFSYFDQPIEVNSNCLVNYTKSRGGINDKQNRPVPSNFAQGGVPDVEIDYGNFTVILEVSAKYKPTLEDYRKQLNGALKHARSLRNQGYEKPIYCILINECSLGLVINKETLKEVLKSIKASEQIYITSLSIDEFAELGRLMSESYEEEISKIQSEDLHEVLKETVNKGIYGNFHEIFVERLDALKYPSLLF